MFRIDFTTHAFIDDGEYHPNAKITLEDYTEYIEIDTTEWSDDIFRAQWKSALTVFFDHKRNNCTLLVSQFTPERGFGLEAWIVFRRSDGNNDGLSVQNKLFFANRLRKYKTLNDFLDRKEKQETITREGEKISEWKVTEKDLRKWLSDLNKIS